LPQRIESLETSIATLTAQMTDPSFYQRDGAAITAHHARLADVQAELDAAYARWTELEDE
jgi:ATP-binding cassette subfamily F protein uup